MRPVSEHRVGRRRSTTCDHISNVAIELFAIAWVRWRFFNVAARLSLFYITVAGLVALAIGVGLGAS